MQFELPMRQTSRLAGDGLTSASASDDLDPRLSSSSFDEPASVRLSNADDSQRRIDIGRPLSFGRWIACVLVETAAIAFSILLFLNLKFGSLATAVRVLRGEVLIAQPTVMDLGELRAAQSVNAVFRLTNYSDVPIAIVGAVSSCSCVATSGLPTTIPSGETRELPVRILPGSLSTTSFYQTVQWLSDSAECPCITVELVGRQP